MGAGWGRGETLGKGRELESPNRSSFFILGPQNAQDIALEGGGGEERMTLKTNCRRRWDDGCFTCCKGQAHFSFPNWATLENNNKTLCDSLFGAAKDSAPDS